MRLARLAALLALLLALPARAEGPRPLEHDLGADVAVTASAAALWLGGEVFQDRLAPARCRFCGTNALDAGARDLLVLGYGQAASRASDVLAFAVLPAGVAAHQLLAARAAGSVREGARDLLFVAEASSVAMAVNQVVKLAVGRQRPYVHYGNYRNPDRRPEPDDNLSFPSGHTTLAFALATSAGTVSSLRGYPSAPWVWAVGMTLATAVGYARIAGDKHYLTDVLAGAATGAAAGVGLPLWLHRREGGASGTSRSAGSTVVPLPLGVLVLF